MKNAGVEGSGKRASRSRAYSRSAPDRAGVQRHLALFLLLAGADVHHAVAEIDILAVERERLPGAHPGDRQAARSASGDARRATAALSLPAAAISAAISCSV